MLPPIAISSINKPNLEDLEKDATTDRPYPAEQTGDHDETTQHVAADHIRVSFTPKHISKELEKGEFKFYLIKYLVLAIKSKRL